MVDCLSDGEKHDTRNSLYGIMLIESARYNHNPDWQYVQVMSVIISCSDDVFVFNCLYLNALDVYRYHGSQANEART